MSAEPVAATGASAADAASPAAADLEAQVEVLEEENRRLREAYSRVRRTRHRRTALGLAAVGVVALAGAALFPTARVVLVVIGATGVFAGLLTWYLTPERFVAADVGERVYAVLAANEAAITAELGLQEPGWYVPRPDGPDREVVLYLPQTADGELPNPDGLEATFVVPDDERRGLALAPTGDPLLAALRQAVPGGLAGSPVELVDQLADGLREQFELVDGVRPDVDVGDGRASLGVSGSAFGAIDRFDHPVPSLLATGLAVGLETPVQVTVDATPDGRDEYLVTANWASDEENGAPPEGGAA